MNEEKEIITKQEAIERGLKRYFTGKPCKWGHVAERVIRGECVVCKNEHNLKWRKTNPDKARNADRNWYKANPDKAREKERKWAKANQEKVRESNRKWREANREKAREKCRKWRESNPEKAREATQKWAKANPEKERERGRKYHSEIKASKNFFQLTAAAAQISKISTKTETK